jgi:Brp/Blh family beta-carotene 15,15'-monooxygenase
LSKLSKSLELWHRRLFLLLSGTIILSNIVSNILEVQLSHSTQIVALLVAVAVTGLPHGALDPLVARRAKLWRRGSGLLAFSLLYVFIAGAVFYLWVLFPGTTLAILLALSVWHFSGDWRAALPRSRCVAAATAVISAPAFWHHSEVVELFSYLAPAHAQLLASFMYCLAPVSLLSLVIVLGRARNKIPKVEMNTPLLIELGVLMLAAALLSPLVYFLVYFCLLHSPRHLLAVTRGFERIEVISYGVIFTLLSLSLALVTFFLLPDTGLDERLAQIVFIGLLALTVPHMLITEHASKLTTPQPPRSAT